MREEIILPLRALLAGRGILSLLGINKGMYSSDLLTDKGLCAARLLCMLNDMCDHCIDFRRVFDKGRTQERTEGSKPSPQSKDAKSTLQYVTKITEVTCNNFDRSKRQENETSTFSNTKSAQVTEKDNNTSATARNTAGNLYYSRNNNQTSLTPP